MLLCIVRQARLPATSAAQTRHVGCRPARSNTGELRGCQIKHVGLERATHKIALEWGSCNGTSGISRPLIPRCHAGSSDMLRRCGPRHCLFCCNSLSLQAYCWHGTLLCRTAR